MSEITRPETFRLPELDGVDHTELLARDCEEALASRSFFSGDFVCARVHADTFLAGPQGREKVLGRYRAAGWVDAQFCEIMSRLPRKVPFGSGMHLVLEPPAGLEGGR